MAVSYQIVVKDQSGVQVALIDDWWECSIYKRVNDSGSFTLAINEDSPYVDLFELDGQVEFWRKDIENGIDTYKEFEGFVRLFRYQTASSGKRTFTVYGVGYTELLSRRIIAYKSGHANSAQSDVGETCMKNFVRQNAGADATVVNGRLRDGIITQLSLEADNANGNNWEGQRAYQFLLEVLQEISLTAEVDFEVVGTGANTYEFRCYDKQLGHNRTAEGLNTSTGLNSYGYYPVTLSLEWGNISNVKYEVDRSNEVNVVYVMGQGVSEEREIVLETIADTLDDSPLNIRETARDARHEESSTGLEYIADELLERRGIKETFEFTVLQITSCLWGKHYFLGDKVVCKYKDYINKTKKIVGADIFINTSQEKINVHLGNIMYGK